ncbi:MAG: DUF5658 family protein [Desulfurococcales archaeon]|nr:DUF5658 family protein [Desulfurococcales archaeon]
MKAKYSLAWILLLQVLDTITTILAVESGASELNPLVARLVGSPWILLAVKLVAGWATWFFARENRTALLVVSILYLQAILANTYNLLQSGLAMFLKSSLAKNL